MGISVADNFSYQGSKPLDSRIKYDSVASMKAAIADTLYDGCLAYVTATQKYYTYDSTNETDPTTGKWRELETGNIQVDVLPTATSALVGTIYQYIGATGDGLTNGYFYKCVSDGEATPTYSWVESPTWSMEFDDLEDRPLKNVTSIDDIVSPIPTPKMYGFDYRAPAKNVIFYVDSDNGSDLNDGKTTTTAFKTIQHAINQLPPYMYYKENDSVSGYGGYIRINTSASAPYKAFAANACFAYLYSWDFINDVEDTNGVLTITTSTAANAIYIEYASVTIYVKDLVITNTNGHGIYVTKHSMLYLFKNNDSVSHNLTITSSSVGLRAAVYSYIKIYGTCANDDQLTINSNSQLIYSDNYSCIEIPGNVSITSSGSNAIFINNDSSVKFIGTGATDAKRCLIEITSAGNTQCIRVSNMSNMILSILNSSIRILHNHSTATNHSVEASQNSFITINSNYELNIESKSSSNSVVRSTSGSAFIIQFGTDASKNYLKGNSSSSYWVATADGLGSLFISGGTANVSPVITGNRGLGVYTGGMIGYANLKNNATTPTGTNTGGRIYTGAQTSVPNY